MKKEELTISSIPELVERLNFFREEAVNYAKKLEKAKDLTEDQRKKLEKDYQDFERMYISTVCTLAEAIDTKSRYTYGHSARVKHYIEEIGKKLNLQEEEINTFSLAATLHDIGRIGIDNAIWEKPGKLTKEEYEVVKKYPEESADILAAVAVLKSVSKIVRHHRENYDGTGYPDNLKGEDIPLGSRILSVVDAFDAMTSERPYRERIDPEVALEELKNKAGTQFDPIVVEAFISMWREMYR